MNLEIIFIIVALVGALGYLAFKLVRKARGGCGCGGGGCGAGKSIAPDRGD